MQDDHSTDHAFEDWGWYCPIHGWYVDGSPDACFDEGCDRWRAISEYERHRYDMGDIRAPRQIASVENRAAIESLLTARDFIDKEIERLRSS